jgi:ABC-type antimicrobial peptide transport system permease subunit
MAIGLQRRQLQFALLLEAIIMVLVAFVAATGLGLVLQFLGINALTATTGLPFTWSFQPTAIGVGALSALVITLAGSLYPARQAGRVPMLEAIAYE